MEYCKSSGCPFGEDTVESVLLLTKFRPFPCRRGHMGFASLIRRFPVICTRVSMDTCSSLTIPSHRKTRDLTVFSFAFLFELLVRDSQTRLESLPPYLSRRAKALNMRNSQALSWLQNYFLNMSDANAKWAAKKLPRRL